MQCEKDCPTDAPYTTLMINIKGAVHEQTEGFSLILCLNDLSSGSAPLTAVKRHRSSCHVLPGSLPLRIDAIFGACRNFRIFYRCQRQTRFDPTKICQSQKR